MKKLITAILILGIFSCSSNEEQDKCDCIKNVYYLTWEQVNETVEYVKTKHLISSEPTYCRNEITNGSIEVEGYQNTTFSVFCTN